MITITIIITIISIISLIISTTIIIIMMMMIIIISIIITFRIAGVPRRPTPGHPGRPGASRKKTLALIQFKML